MDVSQVGNSLSNATSGIGRQARASVDVGKRYETLYGTREAENDPATWDRGDKSWGDKIKEAWERKRLEQQRVNDRRLYAVASWLRQSWVTWDRFPRTIDYLVYNRPVVPSRVAAVGTKQFNALTSSVRSFVYLDVGRWGGSNYFPRARDFGIVCGRTAVLCGFYKEQTPYSLPLENRYRRPEVNHINALLQHLNKPTGHQPTNDPKKPPLGAVSVRGVQTAYTTLPGNRDFDPEKIFVILGDLHLPVISSLRDEGTLKGTFGPRMGRFGQDDVDTEAATYITGEGPTIEVPAHKGTGDMTKDSAIDWYCKYTGSDRSGQRVEQGGDIFEEAGPDLREFVQRLDGFQGDVPVHLLQLGDMFDLWVGMERFFKEAADLVVVDKTRIPPPAAFVDHWIKRSLESTSASAYVDDLRKFKSATWLYGNHDNYLEPNAGVTPTVLAADADSGQMRKEHFFESRLYACHGHQWDSANADGKTFGVDCGARAAFITSWARKIEPESRLDTLCGAAELFLDREDNPFCIFALGHTHVPVITRVDIVDQKAQKK